MKDDKIFLVRGVHPTETAAYALSTPLANILLGRGFDCEIVPIQFEYTIIGWARELGMGEIPKYPLCLNSYNWPELYGREGYIFELHNTDFNFLKKIEGHPHIIVMEKNQMRYDIELPAVFKQNSDGTLERGLSILKKHLAKNHSNPNLRIKFGKYSSFVDMESTEKEGLLDYEITKHCADKTEEVINLVEFEEVNSLGVE